MKTFTFIGAVVGLVVFLAVGLLPAIVYGGFAGVTLASAILGGPIGASVFAKTLVVFGVVVGLLGTGSIFVVMGSLLGAMLSAIARALLETEERLRDNA